MGSVLLSPAPANCPGCQRPLKAGAGEGLCASCLLGQALALASEASNPSDAEADLIAASGLEGRTLGDYEILSTVAQGGMGVVFRARQKNPSRIVALKVISAGELATRRMVERFHNEALAAARLNHPNIVPIHEVGEDRGWHYFSMQLIEGRTLADLVRQGSPEPRVAVELLLKLARAVEHAHQRGILHRDLKPTNILLDAQGEPHLTDFGLAKVSELDSDLTLTHAVLGTPAYMSPEQAAGKSRDITTATDVYGLGVIFYELLSGRPPFRAESTPALLRRIAEEEPAPLTHHASRIAKDGSSEVRATTRRSLANPIPVDLEVICFKCLEKSPARRYATAGELADELERWLRHEPIRARSATSWERSWKWVRRNRALAALAATVVLSGFVLTVLSLLFNLRLDRARDLAEQNATRRHDQLVREHLREAGRTAAAGDGFTGLFALVEALRLEQGNVDAEDTIRRRLGLTLRSSPKLIRLWDAEGSPYRMQFSADNRRLSVAMHRGGLRIWDLVTGAGTALRLTEGEQSFGAVFSPDGNQVAESLAGPPFVRVRRLDRETVVPLPLKQACHGSLAYSAGGKWLLTGGGHLRVWDTTTFSEIRLKDDPEGPWTRTVGSPDDRLILALAPDGTGRLLDTTTWTWRETAEAILSPGVPLPCFSHDGRWLVTFTGRELVLWDTTSGTRKFSAPHSGIVFGPAFSPDGQFLAVPGFREQARVWSLPSPATGPNVLPFRLPIRHETGANQAVFSPDGRLFATAGFDYQLRLHGPRHQLAAPVLHHTALVEAVAFSADGRFLASGDAKGLVRVWDLQPGGVVMLPGMTANPAPLFTADGRQLVARDVNDCVRVWDAVSGAVLGEPLYQPPGGERPDPAAADSQPRVEKGAPMNLAWDVSGKYLAAAVGTEGLRVWEYATRRQVGAWTRAGTVLCVAFDPGGTWLAAGNDAGEIRRWEVATGRASETLQTEVRPVSNLAWSADGLWLAASTGDAMQVWSVRSNAPLAEAMRGRFNALQFSPDGRRLLAALGNDNIAPGAAQIWELPALEAKVPPLEHGDGVASAIFSPDGVWAATGGEDNVVRLWRADSGSVVGRTMRHETVISTLGFDRTQQWLASGSNGGYLRLWSVPGGDLGGPPLLLANMASTVVFSPEGGRVFFGGSERTSWLVSFAPETTALEDVERMARGHTALRSGADGTLEAVSPAVLAAEFAKHLPLGEAFTSRAGAARWHEEFAAPAEATAAWFTAEFHLRRLLALRPDDREVRSRLERVLAAQGKTGR